jgi:hypothetical protein
MNGIFGAFLFPGVDFASWYRCVIRVPGRPVFGSEDSPTVDLPRRFG